MDDIQRWDFFGEVGINEPVRYLHLEAVKGRYVTYADHVAAVAAAQWQNHLKTYDGCMALERAYSEGVKAAREAVAALGNEPQPDHNGDPYAWSEGFTNARFQAIVAIDAINEGNTG